MKYPDQIFKFGAPVFTHFPGHGQIWHERIDHGVLYNSKFYRNQ